MWRKITEEIDAEEGTFASVAKIMPRLPTTAVAVVLLTSVTFAHASEQLEIHYSPQERLDAIDAALIGSATSSIDIAAYTLTDWEVIDALKAANARGVAVRIVVDPRERVDADRLGSLLAQVRTKHAGGPLMHEKAFSVDGALLRDGSANFSHSGETEQNNSLIVIRDAAAATAFEKQFERIWDAAE